jgi:glycosyltransferase involved in cell wall biosynthesis
MIAYAARAPRLTIVGPMLGSHPGHVPFVGEVLGAQLARRGYPVVLTSTYRQKLYRLADIAATVARHARDTDVQILQVYGGLSFVGEDLASWLAKQFGHKIIMHLHGGAMAEFMARHPRWTRRVLSRAAAVVTPSPFLENVMTSFGFAARIIPNAIELSRYPYRHRSTVAPRLLWMRTFHSIYNPEMAIKVLARVKAREPGATLVMAGQDKGTEAAVQRLARDLNVADAVRFAGFLDHAGKLRELGAADIFLNTNHVDNTPVSVIEACAMGLPVVATNVGGIAHLLTDGRDALLVRDDDDEAMAEAVFALVRQPDVASRLSATARKHAERFSWDATRPQWEALLSEVLTAPPADARRGVA